MSRAFFYFLTKCFFCQKLYLTTQFYIARCCIHFVAACHMHTFISHSTTVIQHSGQQSAISFTLKSWFGMFNFYSIFRNSLEKTYIYIYRERERERERKDFVFNRNTFLVCVLLADTSLCEWINTASQIVTTFK